jgi:hypothetical protein
MRPTFLFLLASALNGVFVPGFLSLLALRISWPPLAIGLPLAGFALVPVITAYFAFRQGFARGTAASKPLVA